MAKKIFRSSLSCGTDQRFHVVEIFFQGPSAGRAEAEFSLWQAIGKALGAGDVAGVFQLARVDAQVAVGGVEQRLQRVSFTARALMIPRRVRS